MDWLHDSREVMFSQLWSWLDDSFEVVREQVEIQHAALPNPSDPVTRLDVGLLDPTTVTVIVGYAHLHGFDATGAYVGLIAQDPMGTWRGLTGFFLGWCQGCDPGGETTLKSIRLALRGRGVELKSIWELPAAIHPRAGWFEGDRLLLGALINRRAGLEDLWRRQDGRAHDGPALVATGPVVTTLANLVLVERLDHDLPLLAELRPNPSAWMVRGGRLDALAHLAGIPPTPVRPLRGVARRRVDLPSAWGAYGRGGQDPGSGPVPNLRAALDDFPFARHRTSAVRLPIWYLPPGRAVRLSDVLQLGRP